MRNLIIIGATSVGKAIEQIVYDINQQLPTWNVFGFVDRESISLRKNFLNRPVLGGLDSIPESYDGCFILGFGDPKVRKHYAELLEARGQPKWATLIHPSCQISQRVEIGVGCVLYPGVCIDVDVRIGNHCIFNKMCTLGHDGNYGDYVTTGPAVNIGGSVNVGQGSQFGINSCTIQNVTIGEWSVTGAGAAVTRDVPSRSLALGVPARIR
jgi:sugar O-acyltransferase (sialic acid O-acetyltransferase NeuD family)